ncbi:hypothetical protein Cadr_000004346 [Camelus dromedarius]|uniref:Uncharacterized protein n=1 Tax=Camelus dromedarius TaxID=9838 RepID=A0A5N4EEM9_CAMDR|nr:hypothetical protein Cadr_000004346 [Camelus dromedarius]
MQNGAGELPETLAAPCSCAPPHGPSFRQSVDSGFSPQRGCQGWPAPELLEEVWGSGKRGGAVGLPAAPQVGAWEEAAAQFKQTWGPLRGLVASGSGGGRGLCGQMPHPPHFGPESVLRDEWEPQERLKLCFFRGFSFFLDKLRKRPQLLLSPVSPLREGSSHSCIPSVPEADMLSHIPTRGPKLGLVHPPPSSDSPLRPMTVSSVAALLMLSEPSSCAKSSPLIRWDSTQARSFSHSDMPLLFPAHTSDALKTLDLSAKEVASSFHQPQGGSVGENLGAGPRRAGVPGGPKGSGNDLSGDIKSKGGGRGEMTASNQMGLLLLPGLSRIGDLQLWNRRAAFLRLLTQNKEAAEASVGLLGFCVKRAGEMEDETLKAPSFLHPGATRSARPPAGGAVSLRSSLQKTLQPFSTSDCFPASTHGGVYGDPGVSHQLGAFIESHPANNTAGGGLRETQTKTPGPHFLHTCVLLDCALLFPLPY